MSAGKHICDCTETPQGAPGEVGGLPPSEPGVNALGAAEPGHILFPDATTVFTT
jgi:hypothetical protein